MKKIVIIALFLTVLCGCSKNSAGIDIKNKQYEGDGYKISMEIPEIQLNSEFAESFNEEYRNLADSMLNNFSSEAEKSDVSDDTMTFKQEIKFNKNGIISIIGDCDAYTGGPHGTLSRVTKNIDVTTGRTLSLSDLFNDGEYVKRINSYIEVLSQTNPEKFADLWKTPSIEENQEFYITSKGIVIFYPPYALSYYSKGFVEIEIPYAELESYLNPEYSKIIWQ